MYYTPCIQLKLSEFPSDYEIPGKSSGILIQKTVKSIKFDRKDAATALHVNRYKN